jgi:hypothetical protein
LTSRLVAIVHTCCSAGSAAAVFASEDTNSPPSTERASSTHRPATMKPIPYSRTARRRQPGAIASAIAKHASDATIRITGSGLSHRSTVWAVES